LNLVIDGLACAILVRVAAEDMRGFRIRNVWVAALIGLFLAASGLGLRPDAVWHALFAGVALAAMLAAFALRWVGAGDAKLIVAACLWVGPALSPVFAVALLATTLVYAAGAALAFLPSRRSGGRTAIPFGPSIAAAWILALIVSRSI